MLRVLQYLWLSLVLAFGGLRRNLLRGVLTSFGILIGVAAVTIVVALGEGASKAVTEKIDAFGENVFVLVPRDVTKSGAKNESKLSTLTESDARMIVREVSSVQVTAPLLVGNAHISREGENSPAMIFGTSRGFFQARSWDTARGAVWPVASELTGEKVCVIGKTVATDLFGEADPVGQMIRVGKHPFRVVGQLKAKGQGAFGFDEDKIVVMPIATMRAKVRPTRPGQVDRILISGKDRDVSETLRRDITRLMRQRHSLLEGMEDDFSIRGQDDFRKAQEQILGALQALLLAIAGVSLLVGGIGVMNIMLVSVAERTREIGIRMAIGARESDIMLQFLVESVVLSVAGGLAGALLALATVAGIAHALSWEMGVSWTAMTVAMVTSSGVGVVFGFFPARRAAQLDPIQALRRE